MPKIGTENGKSLNLAGASTQIIFGTHWEVSHTHDVRFVLGLAIALNLQRCPIYINLVYFEQTMIRPKLSIGCFIWNWYGSGLAKSRF